MPGAMARVKEEVRRVFAAALFFSTGFVLLHFAEVLFTRGTSVELASVARAVIGGLIVAKLLLLVDLVPFVQAFPEKPLVHNIVWKSSIYVAAAVAFQYLEPLIKHLWHGRDLADAHHRAVGELAQPRTWAIMIWVAMLLVVFVAFQEMARVMGKEKLRLMFLGR
jgi:hypothetical protein